MPELEVFGTTTKLCKIDEECKVKLYMSDDSPVDVSEINIRNQSELMGQVDLKQNEDISILTVEAPQTVDLSDAIDQITLSYGGSEVTLFMNYSYDSEFEFNEKENYIQETGVILDFLDSDLDLELLVQLRQNSDKLYALSDIENELDDYELVSEGSVTKPGKELIEFICSDYTPLITTNYTTKKYQYFKTASDLEWHCANCELPGAQPARNAKDLRNLGFKEEKDGAHYSTKKYCDVCSSDQTHRRLLAPVPLDKSKVRETLPSWFIKKAKKVLSGESESSDLEIDHKRPHIRATSDEELDLKNMSDEEIKDKFQLLSTSRNQKKREKCKKCVKTGKRPALEIGRDQKIKFFYEGDEKYIEQVGCEGCPYYDTDKWLEELEDTVDSEDIEINYRS